MPNRPLAHAVAADRAAAASPWQPLGGAFAASFVLHGLALISLASLFVHPAGIVGGSISSPPLFAVLAVGPREAAPEATPPAAPHPVPIRPMTRTVRSDVPVPTVAVPPPTAAASAAPWARLPVAVDPPAGLFGTPMVSEGVEFFETRNIVQLGVDVERRILAEFPGKEPEYAVVLHPPETLGYPLDALMAGVEGRVLVWFGVDEEGKVVAREALDGPAELVDWTLARVDRLVAGPARNKDGPVRAWVALEITFSRDAAEAARPTR